MRHKEFVMRGAKYLVILAVLFFSSVPPADAARRNIVMRTVTGVVTRVLDGDTVQVTTPEQTALRIRTYGNDAPETEKINHRTGQIYQPGQPYGNESWRALEEKIMGQTVSVDIIDIDKYRRLVGIIWLAGRNINLEMIREGYAEVFVEFVRPPYRAPFLEAEREAKAARRGIWSISGYERPVDFRRRTKNGSGE